MQTYFHYNIATLRVMDLPYFRAMLLATIGSDSYWLVTGFIYIDPFSGRQ